MDASIKKFGFDDPDADTIVFSFAGQGRALVVDFEWVNFFTQRKVKLVCVKDAHKAYYMGDLYGDDGKSISKGVDSHTELFQSYINESKCKNVVLTGSSLGGYAAALYGVLLNANYVLPYSAQTFIRKHPVYGRNDRPHLSAWARRRASNEDKQKYFDLTDLNYDNFTGEMHFHWSKSWRDDRYFKHMSEFCETYKTNQTAKGIIDTKIHGVTYRHANLCKCLKKSGLLKEHFDGVLI